MKLNNALFIDVEKALTRTNSGREFPLHMADWKFNDNILKHIKDSDYDVIVIIGNRPISKIFDKRSYNRFIDLVFDNLFKIIKKPIYIISNYSKDTYLNYPNPGGIFTMCLDNDINLKGSTYIADDLDALENSCAGIQHLYTDFIND